MSRQHRFLLIHGPDENHWHHVLRESLSAHGELLVEREESAMRRLMLEPYDLVIIDSSAIRNVPLLIARVCAQRPGIKVVVATASPSWSDARDAFQAGATDYINKSYDKQEIEYAVKMALDKELQPNNGGIDGQSHSSSC